MISAPTSRVETPQEVFQTWSSVAGRGLERDLERPGEVLAQVVAGAGLQRLVVLHQRLAAVGPSAPANRSLSVFLPVTTGIAIHSSMNVR